MDLRNHLEHTAQMIRGQNASLYMVQMQIVLERVMEKQLSMSVVYVTVQVQYMNVAALKYLKDTVIALD